MKHLTSPGALVTIGIAAILVAGGLLGLQIVLGIEYTAGATIGTQASMIAAMVTVALLPVFFALSRRYKAPGYITAAIAVSFFAFLAYSLPATTGRTGEMKEAKAAPVAKALEDKARIQADYDATKKLVDESNEWQPKACKGGVGKECKSATFVLNQRQASLEKLGAQLDAFEAPPAGDTGSDIWAWALSWIGLTAAMIRKGSVLAFAVGLDFAIWSLAALGEFMFSSAVALWRDQAVQLAVPAPQKAVETETPRALTQREIILNWQQQADLHVPETLPSPELFSGDQPDPNKPKKKAKRSERKDRVIAKIRAQTLSGKRPSLKLVTARYRLPKSTAHRYLEAATTEAKRVLN